MSQIFRFTKSFRQDPAIESWFDEHADALGAIARRWFEVLRGCGDDVREILHDGHPTACVEDAAFGIAPHPGDVVLLDDRAPGGEAHNDD